MSAVSVEGFTAKRFSRVRDVLTTTPSPFGRGGGAVSVYAQGELVVDLWGGNAAPGEPWRRDTRSCVASVTKAWAAIVVHRLVEQGVLDLTTPLREWWPEFAAEGKGGITLTDVLLHTSGVLGFDGQQRLLDGRGWQDVDGLDAALAASTPRWRPGTQHGYHAVSFGWLLNAVVRRASGSTIGELFEREVAKPLDLDTRIGIGPDELEQLARAVPGDLSEAPRGARLLARISARRSRDPNTLAGFAFLADGQRNILDVATDLMSSPDFMAAEVPASNGVCSARSLAKLFAALANGGSLGGVQVVSPSTLRAMSEVQARRVDSVASSALPPILRTAVGRTPMSLGLAANQKMHGAWLLGPTPSAFGAAGFGEQVVMADPDAGLSIASIRTDFTPGGGTRVFRAVRDAVYAA